jgi:hypothetical protein
MLLTLHHLEREYGGVVGYVEAIGLTPAQISQLRRSLLE